MGLGLGMGMGVGVVGEGDSGWMDVEKSFGSPSLKGVCSMSACVHQGPDFHFFSLSLSLSSPSLFLSLSLSLSLSLFKWQIRTPFRISQDSSTLLSITLRAGL